MVGRPVARRTVLRGALAAGVASPFLAACGGGDGSSAGAGPEKLPAPDNPVTWSVSKANPAIESGLVPEAGSTLRIYNYADYLSPKMLKDFEKKYSVDIRLSTFNDADEALTKIASKNLKFDLYFPSYDSVGRLIQGDLLRPLNHDYLPNTANLWTSMQDPWWDKGAQYTIPYTVYSTGIAWRTDQVPTDIEGLDNPYDVLWDPTYKGKMAILDDWHAAMAMVLLRNGVTDINTTDEKDIAMVREQLLDLRKTMDPRVTISMYTDLPAGQYGLCQAWSGDAINMPYYLPDGTSPDLLRYWFPEDGVGEVDNDLVVCLAQGENPVAAHVFMNELLDPDAAGTNFGFTGYQPPLTAFTPDTLVKDGYVPENLARAVVRESDFDTGVPLLQLPAATDAAYHQVWQEFKAGG
ncbi:polyamine ABC transporter substrate-binding protein [Nocardioides sp.]|uniref:polyamine ABC transporter substrate-binding protein n=1 Tax=Nocardioides sp. TaxID=35761 RepID=UPI003D0DE90A